MNNTENRQINDIHAPRVNTTRSSDIFMWQTISSSRIALPKC